MDNSSLSSAATRASKRPPVADILRMLFADAERRIAGTPQPIWSKLIKISPTAREVFADYKHHHRIAERLQKRLSKMGYSHWGKTLSPSSTATERKRNGWLKEQADRRLALRDLRLKVGLDLLGMSISEAKKYIRRLEKTLEKI